MARTPSPARETRALPRIVAWRSLVNRMFKTIDRLDLRAARFQSGRGFCDIKRLGTGKGSEKGRKRDLALIVSDVPAAVAGMFTTNQVCAAPVKVSAPRAAKNLASAIVVNSGNANACTGHRGIADAKQMTEIAGSVLKLKASDVLVCSTGRIGVPMPMKNVERGIRECAPLLARSTTNARQVAEAIMTTDTRRKEIAVEFKIDNRAVRIGGICKGAGMIQPGMEAQSTRRCLPLLPRTRRSNPIFSNARSKLRSSKVSIASRWMAT